MLLSGLGFLALARSFWRRDLISVQRVGPRTLRDTAVRYRQFPLYSVPEALLNTAGLEIPILIIAALAAGPEAGFLMLAMRVLGIPMALVGNSVSQVYLTEAAGQHRSGGLAALTIQTMWAMFRVGAPILVVAAAVSPFLFPFIFGDAWYRAGIIVAWLAPMFLFQFVASPVISILHVTNRLPLAMLIQLIGALFRISAVLFAVWHVPALIVETFAISGFLFYLMTLILMTRVVAHPPASAAQDNSNRGTR
jgi:O-antigen/teichoic acid export membrane protein